jgi:hypothetical protein
VQAYGFSENAVESLKKRWGEHPYSYKSKKWCHLNQQEKGLFSAAVKQMCSSQWSLDAEIEGSRRLLTKKGFFSDRVLEVLAHSLSVHPSSVVEWLLQDGQLLEFEENALAKDILSFCLGCAFGRWDVRGVTNQADGFSTPDAFDPVPLCPPGLLVGADGKPATQTPENYRWPINFDGVLVDDRDNSADVVRRVREFLELIWKDRVEGIEREVCKILDVNELREYFRRPGKGGFWLDHVSRYSKSRRKAPIYWLLQSSRKNYALWLYYLRLDKDLLFKALKYYVEPKVQRESNRLDEMRRQKQSAGESGKGAKKLQKDIERQEDLIFELRDFEDRLRNAANLHLEPDLNDGVVLNIAPLHELVPWKEAADYWEELVDGEYEWSSLGKQLRQKGIVK